MPDADAVRAALAEIGEAKSARCRGEIDIQLQMARVWLSMAPVIYAARSWLAEQDHKEASDVEVS